MELTDSNFFLYCARHYDNPNCVSLDEFKEDLLRFKYLKKLFFNYKNKSILKERLILNHLVVLYNVFPAKECTLMLVNKLEEYLDCLFPFLEVMGYLPKGNHGVTYDDIIVKRLRAILKEGS